MADREPAREAATLREMASGSKSPSTEKRRVVDDDDGCCCCCGRVKNCFSCCGCCGCCCGRRCVDKTDDGAKALLVDTSKRMDNSANCCTDLLVMVTVLGVRVAMDVYVCGVLRGEEDEARKVDKMVTATTTTTLPPRHYHHDTTTGQDQGRNDSLQVRVSNVIEGETMAFAFQFMIELWTE